MAQIESEEEWQLTQQTFNVCLENMSLSAPAIGPWVERMVLGYEARGRHEEAWQLTQDMYDECIKRRISFGMLGGMGVLSRLLYAYRSSRRSSKDLALLGMIPRQEILELLASDKPSIFCRSLLSRILRDNQSGCSLICLRLGRGRNKLQVHQDVLCYWSKYFERALSGRWSVPEVFDLNPDNEFPPESLKRIFNDFIYTGNYKGESNEDRVIEKGIAEYFQIDHLMRTLH
ncbi:BTB POZ domain-containing protein [Fusarium mundagurra]|uniref:BTB POZ domain-containing protein n=1 Tax=Fusarium mundagurra TaxID=1567541 RepID=A0A8H5Y6P6_9HYPO|nr:BTB POZ domain-containing protein [Fusarium mundagurra]